jgi:hypothetical protein
MYSILPTSSPDSSKNRIETVLIAVLLSGQWSKALPHSTRGVTTIPGSIPGCAAAGRDRVTHEAAHNWPNAIRVRGGFGRHVLVPSCSSDSLWGAGHMHADFGRKLYGISYDILVQLASWLSEHCVKKQCGMRGCVSEDTWLFASPESVLELQRWDKTVTTNWIVLISLNNFLKRVVDIYRS